MGLLIRYSGSNHPARQALTHLNDFAPSATRSSEFLVFAGDRCARLEIVANSRCRRSVASYDLIPVYRKIVVPICFPTKKPPRMRRTCRELRTAQT